MKSGIKARLISLFLTSIVTGCTILVFVRSEALRSASLSAEILKKRELYFVYHPHIANLFLGGLLTQPRGLEALSMAKYLKT
jgi:hypothetical protein